MRGRTLSILLLLALCLGPGARAAPPLVGSRFLIASDGVRLHFYEAGTGQTILFVPGWTMPAWIWWPQIVFFARSYHVIAFDPRGQGLSEVAASGYEPGRRGQDIADMIAEIGRETGPAPVLLAGWSLGVLDALAYVHTHGDARLAGLVLVDNSVGEDPPPPPPIKPSRHRRAPPPLPREAAMRRFVQGMFRTPQTQTYIDALTQATLTTPDFASRALLSYPVPRSYWREAVYATAKPVLYVVRPALSGQAANLALHHPAAETAVFADAGHALFIDDAARFDTLMADFIRRRVWP